MKSWKLPMIEKIVAMTIEPRSAGILMPQMMRNCPAPSISAASYSSVGNDLQRRVEDEHVVAHELPRDDVADRCEDPVGAERLEDLGADEVVDRARQAELVAVDEAPDEGGDDAGDGVGQEDRDAEEAGAVQARAVEGERGAPARARA